MSSEKKNQRLTVNGFVQGVGFRPFVYRLAHQLKLTGWVANSTQGVLIEIEGSATQIETFITALHQDLPPPGQITHVQSSSNTVQGHEDFIIKSSIIDQNIKALIVPDLATCNQCIQELNDPSNPRYRYPFINCTYCGPRFSMIEALPYDRPLTSMKTFQMCPDCQNEYNDPLNRRFHAQPIACPQCGPQLSWWNQEGEKKAHKEEALSQAINSLKAGEIIAIKGLSGFHLMADPFNMNTMTKLRELKARPHKAFALMYPNLFLTEQHCHLNESEKALLTSIQAPIVLLKYKKSIPQSLTQAAPDCQKLGIMLPYTPLHHLLMQAIKHPLIATSGNLSGEPVYTDEKILFKTLSPQVKGYLIHNRPILHFADDSVAMVIKGKPCLIRRARGYTPMPIEIPLSIPESLAVGAHLKNTIAVAKEGQLFLSQHIGDLTTPLGLKAFKQSIRHLQDVYRITPDKISRDLHPDYLSSQYAQTLKKNISYVQHHHAHILSCMAEHHLPPPLLGVAWDGSGLGTDGTIWGGEFLEITTKGFNRLASLKPFPLPGGERAMKEPFRAAIGILYSVLGKDLFELDLPLLHNLQPSEKKLFLSLLERKVNTPFTSSMGRFFDAIAAILNLCQFNSYEAQAAIILESQVIQEHNLEPFPFEICHSPKHLLVDYQLIIQAILEALENQTSVPEISTRFHMTLVEIIYTIARESNHQSIVLSGGCFQNKYLLEVSISRLEQAGFQIFWNQRIPSNDGGIAVGQIMATERL